MKKITLGILSLLFGMSVYAGNTSQEIKLPENYQKEYFDPIKKTAYFINQDIVNGRPSIIFSFVSDTAKNNIWLTNCQHTLQKGIQVFTCFTQQEQFGVGTGADGNVVIFRFEKRQELATTKINYKVDNKTIVTLPASEIPNGPAANAFIRQLKQSRVLTYSWKNGSKYQSEQIKLDGLEESLDFAKKMVELNN